MTRIENAFVVATQNAYGPRNFIRAFVGEDKETLEKAVACARENADASVWAGKTGQMRYNDVCRTLEKHMFDGAGMAQWAVDLVWYKGSLCGRFALDQRYA